MPWAPKRTAGPSSTSNRPLAFERVEIDRLDDQADVVGVLTCAGPLEQIDEGVAGDACRRERRLAPPPLLDPNRRETELAAIEGEGTLDVGDVEHDVIELGYP